MLKIGILVFNGVEELDFIAPFEVLSYANKIIADSVKITLIAETEDMITAFNGLRFLPDKTFAQIQDLDILIVPGGKGRLVEMHNKNIHEFIHRLAPGLRYLAAVCTGALILAETGFLEDCVVTTHHNAWAELATYPNVEIDTRSKVVEQDFIITSAGVSSGLELGFRLLQLCFDDYMAKQVAMGIEYIPRFKR